jgi:signal peptidase I
VRGRDCDVRESSPPLLTSAVAAKRRSSTAPAPSSAGAKSGGAVAAAKGRTRGTASAAGMHGTWEFVKSILGAVAIFLFVRAFLVEAYRIPSGSMIPTLLVGDWLFVNKLAYGPHIPFTSVNLPGYDAPERGEVIVFVSPYQADEARRGADPTPTLVKRLVGVPGDTLHMRGGLLHVNGVPKPQGAEFAVNRVGEGGEVSPLFDWMKPLGLDSSRFGPAPRQPTHDDWGPLVVPAERYFMLGDNRYDSKDGRYWGLVPRDNVRGRPLFIYFSIDWPRKDIRWSRIGDWVR